MALAAGLSACGGGSGGGNVRSDPPPASPPPVPPPTNPGPTPPVVSDPNPAYSQHIALTNTQSAHDAGLTGAGVVVGVVDSGVNHEHPALQGRVTNLVYIPSPPNDLTVDDVVGHGTAVSQVIAGTPFGEWPGGIAPGADIVSARIIWDEAPEDDGSGEGNEVDGALGLQGIHDDLVARGARVMNNSWGGLYWNDPAATAPIADEYRDFIFANDGLVVFAAGNESRANPTDMAALPSQPGPNGTTPAADLERGWLTVVALDTDNPDQLASYSNACGVAMNYCLAAPGNVVVTGTDNAPDAPDYWLWRGTSLAAPQVSGAAALVWEAFPWFSNDQVRQTILGTANDLGERGVDEVFGYGALNVGRAIHGPGRFDWGDFIADFDGVTSKWGNTIQGAGGLVKDGSGTLVLDAVMDYEGDTRVLGGTLQLKGVLTNSRVHVATGGTLAGGGWIQQDLENFGTVALDGGATSVGGDYIHGADARLAVLLPSRMYVDGTATIQGGELHVLGAMGGYVVKEQEDVLTAYGGLSGTFDRLTSASGVLLEATLSYDEYRVWLNVSRLDVAAAAMSMASITPVSLASAQRVEAAFDGIDAGQGSGSVTDDFIAAAGRIQAAATEKQAVDSLQSLSGEFHVAADAMTFDGIQANRRALSSRFGDLAGQPRLQGDWYRSLGEPGQGGLASGHFSTNGWTMGNDARLGETAIAGFAFGETRADGFIGDRGDRSRDRQTQAQFYAGGMRGDAYAMGQVGVGRYERQLRRGLLLGDRREGVATDYAGDFFAASAEAGYRFGGSAGVLMPYAGVEYVRLQREGFIENGADGFGLKADASTAERTQAVAGLRAQRGWTFAGGRSVALHGFAEWQRSLSESGLLVDASFVGTESWSPLYGEGFSRSGGLFGVGLDAALSRSAAWSFGYDRRFGSDFDDRQWSTRLRFGF